MSIHPDTSLGAVFLTVQNLGRSLDFYQTRLGLQLNNRSEHAAQLGVTGRDLLVLAEDPQSRPYPRSTGLYHFAIKVPTRLDLAYSLQHIINTRTAVQGFADHWVSEAIYLTDPDGIGIEIYCDRASKKWQYESGQLQMGTDALNVDGLLRELSGQTDDWKGLHPDTTIGHIHLQVRDLDSAEAFYRDVLGFDLVLRNGQSASFLATGGYHHHIGINTWSSLGAAPPPTHSSGLRWFIMKLPGNKALQDVTRRIKQAGLDLVERETGYLVHDPSANGILLSI